MTVEKLITDHIDIWSSALQTRSTAGRGSNGKIDLYGIKKLRELILELAVRGKLVPQDPNDEPASELLKRIAAEKAELLKQGKIKKQKPLPEISEDEKPFELPSGWEWVRLGDAVEVINGRAYKKHEMLQTGTPLLRVGNLFTSNEWYYSDLELDEDKYIDKDDLIYAWSASFGPFIWQGDKVIYHYHIWKLKLFSESALSKYFLHDYLASITEKIKSQGNGIAMLHMTKERMEKQVIALPPLAEQINIVSKIKELMSLCDQLEQQTLTSLDAHSQLVETLLATLTESQNAEELAENWARISLHFDTLFTTEASIDALKQTVLQLAVMGLLIESAEFSQLDHLKKHLSFGPKNGLSPSEVKYETDIKVLKLGATSYGYLKLQETKYVDIDVSDKLHLFLKKNDILIQRGNSSNFVGCSLLIEEDFDNLIYPDLMMKIKTKDELLPEYATLWLSSPFARNYMWSKMTGTSGTMPKISKKVVEDVPIAVPPLAVQHQLVIKIKELFLLCGSLKSRLQSAQQTQLHLADALTDAALN
ncbi:MAG: restriction endonuclease subunit S [Hafnia sp.]